MDAGFRYLNVRNEWPGLRRTDLEFRADGALILAPAGTGFAPAGSFVAGPLSVGDLSRRWQRLTATVDPLPDGTHLRFASFVDAGGPADPPHPEPTPEQWRSAPRDLTDLLVDQTPGVRLWLRGDLYSDGTATPALHQLRISFDADGYLAELPAVFREQPGDLPRLLALLESFLSEAETRIDDLPQLFDAAAVPAAGAASWLDWLASWLALPLPEGWSEQRRRDLVAAAFVRYGRRGTRDSLREYLRLYTGADVRISEPSRTVWSLGRASRLGRDTRLAPAQAQGAVLDRTAVLDHSHLTAEEDFGASLFAGDAFRFCVTLRPRDRDRAEAVRAVLDREKPAHTVYELCRPDGRARVGQVRLGVDAYVAGPPEPWVLDAPGADPGHERVLPVDPHPAAVGRDARVGRTRLRKDRS